MPDIQARVSRYHGEQDSKKHPGQLRWPGINGIPVIAKQGEVPELLLATDRARFKPLITYHCKLFDLSNTADLQEYTDIMERIASGWYVLRHQTRHEQLDKEPPRMLSWVEWLQQYMIPAIKQDAGGVPNGRTGTTSSRVSLNTDSTRLSQ